MLLANILPGGNDAFSPVGDWIGVLEVQTLELHLALHVFIQDQNVGFIATLDSINQGATGIPTNAILWKDDAFSFDVPAIQGQFQGVMEADGMSISGSWTQGSRTLPLTWTRGVSAIALDRPQEPKPPFPYRSEEVWVDNADTKVRLSGTFTVPTGQGPFPTVFLISGSGPQDRNETVFGHKPFLVLADFLTRHGVAVLRVDDRGVGTSTGTFKEATTADFTMDALAAVGFLSNHADVDHAHIGLIGHSEGAIIAPMVAVQSEVVSFVVLLAGTGVPGEVLLPEQVYRSALATGQPEQTAREAAMHTAAWMNAFNHADTADKAMELMQAPPRNDAAVSTAQLEAEMRAFGSPWFRYFAKHDPYPILQKVMCPVFALNGSEDVQVPAALNIPFLRAAVAWNHRSRVEIAEGVNHLFQNTHDGSPLKYVEISETMSVEILQQISDFIHKQL